MGYLLKEALKTLCGVNQWSYAVYWKIGCQNPKLLIWEDCYNEPATCPTLPGNENLQTAFQDYNNTSWVLAENNLESCFQADKVHFLVNKMMMENHVHIVGQGLVGRVAFTGNHEWILSDNYFKDARPPEVLKEVCQQFSAGMQTVAVIPVLPYGVVQFGSGRTIMENKIFVDEVTSLIRQLGYIPGVLLSENYAAKEFHPTIGEPEYLGNFAPGGLSHESSVINDCSMLDSYNHFGSLAQTSVFDCQPSYSLSTELQNDVHTNIPPFQASNSCPSQVKPHDYHQKATMDDSSANQIMDQLAKAEVLPSNADMWLKQTGSAYIPRSNRNLSFSSSSMLNHDGVRCMEPEILTDGGSRGHASNANVSTGTLMSALVNPGLIYSPNSASVTLPSVEVNELCQDMSSTMKPLSVTDHENTISMNPSEPNIVQLSAVKNSNSDNVNLLARNPLLAYGSGSNIHNKSEKFPQNELSACKEEIEHPPYKAHDIPPSQSNENLNMSELIRTFGEDDMKQKLKAPIHPGNIIEYGNPGLLPPSGDDLFDVLGSDFKNNLLGSWWMNNESSYMHNPNKKKFPSHVASSEICSTSKGNTESAVFSSTVTDHLLDAVVSKVHPSSKKSLDDNVSCRTTLTNTSSSSAAHTSLPYGRFGLSDSMKEELFGVPKYQAKAGAMSSCSLKSRSSMEDSVTYSQGSSVYGSQVSSWIGKGQNTKPNNSVSTGYSKKTDETGKTGRKRLKPGENPRPRPKDRQMIQDRVKELREIVPNGAKCSIDALLERTIKHMLFLQSVTKHADKLKQTGESKIIGKDGGLLLKDDFEGGATWAYEVGSQSLVCPIIVEDLNQPRQMLVEMLCEERGLFLEIADIIRGLGLTILKGVMESRSDKIWARFVVEANRDVTRMEIFISLVRLLEQSAKTGPSQFNCVSSENMMAHQLHQAASVPMAGSQ